MNQRDLVVVAHNIRSAHNVGSIFRTCDGFGANHLFLTGYTPHPFTPGDPRLPHIVNKLTSQIHKTALGAEITVPFDYQPDAEPLIAQLKKQGYQIAVLEQTPDAIMLPEFKPHDKIALLLGEEVFGVPPRLLAQADVAVEIPMRGQKESFNVSVACGIALYALCT